MKQTFAQIKKRFNKHTWIALIIVFAALLVEIISAMQYYYTKDLLERELEKNTLIEITMKAILVKSMLNTTEQVLNSHLNEISRSVKSPDDIGDDLLSIVEANSFFKGAFVAFKPGYYGGKDNLYEPWAFNSDKGVRFVRNIADRVGHDYTNYEFFTEPMRTGKSYWSDPYIDTVESKSLITTYSVPVTDTQGDTVGVAGIDLSLDWLSDSLNFRHIYPSSYCLLLTDDGRLISQPAKTHPRHEDFDAAVHLINDSNANVRIVEESKIRVIEFVNNKKQDACVFFHHMRGRPHWQVAVVCYDSEVFGKLNKVRLHTALFMLLAFSLLGYIIYRFLKNNRRLAKNELERERLNSELQVAKRIQSEMLPDGDVAHDNVDIAAELLSAREVGGDIYDYFLRDDKLLFCIGDASGKGVASALIMSVAHSMFRSFGSRESNPARIMQKINQTVCHGNESSMFVTFFIGVLDLPTGNLYYCNAGHDTPLIVDSGVHHLDIKPNLPLGVDESWFFEGQNTVMKPGETLLLYTDGLTEAMDAGHRLFGLKRVEAALERHIGEESRRLLDGLKAACHEFVDGAAQSDDLTLLAVRFTPKEEQPTLFRRLIIDNSLSHVPEVNDFVTAIADELRLPESDTRTLELAIEEAVVNVINYAYPAGEKGDIDIEASATESALKFKIIDSGVAFAPTDAPEVDTSLTAEERKIGGLGILLVRQSMDIINYERIDHKNVLTLTKKLNSPQPGA